MRSPALPADTPADVADSEVQAGSRGAGSCIVALALRPVAREVPEKLKLALVRRMSLALC